jgi:hypothetical protein
VLDNNQRPAMMNPPAISVRQVVRGFFAYHAVPTNWEALKAFRHHIERIRLRTLRRRSQASSRL